MSDQEATHKRPCGNHKCAVSTGICERLTYGKGKLDDWGYWEYPCQICARFAELRDGEKPGTYWPPLENINQNINI